MDTSLSALMESLRGRYDLDRLIGRGGMADVYLATDQRHGRPVAVKILHAPNGMGLDAARFVREIEIAARLQHPNILPVYDSGEAAGCLFFVMPYVEGGTLRKRLERDGRLSWNDAFTITREIAGALAFAHSRGVVHRDVKPENILFFAGHAVVADFGIARAIAQPEGERITQAGVGLGTPEYMSPEQAFGEENVDARSDVYSLGCVLYEMLSGAPPWTGGKPFALLVRKTVESPPPLEAGEASDVPYHVSGVLQRALAREPDDRHPDIPGLMADLAAVPAGRGTRVTETAPALRTPRAMPSIAVLPLVNLSGNPNDDYLSDGLSEELIHALAGSGGIHVVARTSSFRFKGHAGDIRAIGAELEVASILEGSVRRAGNRLRISARLIDTGTGFERWSERFDREFEDVFEVQDEIARAIVASLENTFRPQAGALVQPATTDMEAYALFLEARFCWNQRTTSAIRRSVELLQRAVARDAAFAAAHAALAESCVTLAMYGDGHPSALMSQAREAAEQALRYNSGLSSAHTALACVRGLHDWNWTEAERHFRVATRAADPSATAFQWYAANLLVPLGRFTEARSQLARARSLDPLSPAVTLSVGVTYHSEGDELAAIREFQVVLARDPQFGMAHYFLGRALAGLARYDEALGAMARAEALLGSSLESIAARGVILGFAGRVDEAEAVLEALRVASAERYVSHVYRAEILAALDRRDAALGELALAVEDRATDLVWIGARRAFARLADEPAFVQIIRTLRIALPPSRSGDQRIRFMS